MKFLKLFFAFFKKISVKNEFEHPNPVDSQEQLSRFIFSSNQFSKSAAVVKPGAFDPAPKTRNTSVFRSTALTEIAIWDLCAKHIEPFRKKEAVARADLRAASPLALNLVLVTTPLPHPRHVDIEGWPDDIEIKQISVELAKASRLIVRAKIH